MAQRLSETGTIMTFTTTGATAAPPATTRLAELPMRVQASKEVQAVCEKILSRLQLLHRQLDHMIMMTATSSTGSNGSNGVAGTKSAQQHKALSEVTELATQFDTFLRAQSTQNIVYRLTDTRRVGGLLFFHEELDVIFRMLRLEHVDPVRQWRAEWAQDREDMEQRFKQAVGATEVLYRELRSPADQIEALAMLRTALEKAQRQNSVDKDAALTTHIDLLKTTFRRLVSFAKVEIPVVPSWFLSPAELSIQDEAFAGGDHVEMCYATWGRFKTHVVIKRLTAASSEDEFYRTKLVDEAKMWSTFDHLHLLRMHGGSPVSSPPYVVLERPTNGTLDEYLQINGENRRLLFKLLVQTADGLKYLHEERRLCHGDLKLSNIYVGNDGYVKLGNFTSFFIPVDSETSVHSGQEPTGSVRWMAPELLDSDASVSVSFEADVYAFGMCILEAASSDLPWSMMPDSEVRQRVLAGEIPARPAHVDDSLWALITSMCAPEPTKRPSMSAVLTQLEQLAAEEAQLLRQGSSVSNESEDLTGTSLDLNKTMFFNEVDIDELISSRSNNPPGSLANSEPVISVVTLHHKWLGIKINSIGHKIVVSTFLRSSSGALGEIEASGQVKLGDVIVAVNNRSVRGMSRHQLGSVIQSTPRPMELMFKREPELLEECFQFHGLRLEERWRDRGSVAPLPGSLERVFGFNEDTFTFSTWFSLNDADDTFFGGILLGAQDISCAEQSWAYCHHQLIMIDPHGNLSCFFLQDSTPVLIAADLSPARWYHLVITFSENELKVYLDGAVRHSARGSLNNLWSKLTHANIGSGCISKAPSNAKPTPDFCGWYGFNGLVHDACVWHSVLPDMAITQLYRGGSDCVDDPFFSLRRDLNKESFGPQVPRRVMASRPHHVVAQTY
ncbi:hypothetical protein Poli38472_004387 [Pythium oligandrum]|uniref:TKL/TKL-CCIN protein kinase n=1 Tax=Pythium oligandrum TaxID=41045 RepID=A0A8K1CAV6_PYTOL|nr:hypothetical protein Poli38472_004387 [Pythium oligandrum]|eukprot:TMW59318.1 hypothetical protein Poli38472_004387 [Pythium oligandrum]